MADLNQTDLNVRLQRASCCIGSFGHQIATEFAYGKTCANNNLKQLLLLEIWLDMLTNYQVNIACANSVSIITINSGTAGNISTLTSEYGTLIGSAVSWQGSTTATATALAAAINAYNPNVFTALASSNMVLITRDECEASTGKPAAVVTGDISITIGNWLGGVDAVDNSENNCITEEEAQRIAEEISEICDICFATIGTSYS